MRIITLDMGNSHPHAGVFLDNQRKDIVPIEKYQFQDGDIRILCSVRKNTNIEHEFNLENFKKDSRFFDMPFNYTQSVGIDRLVVAYKSFKQIKPTQKILIIDAGTFLTADLISAANGFEGGWIFPGIKTYLNSFQNGELLPKLEFKNETIQIPHNTESAIINGGNIYLEAILKEILNQTSPSNILVTGGSGKIILDILKKFNLKIELQFDSTLIHDSMYLIHQTHLKY